MYVSLTVAVAHGALSYVGDSDDAVAELSVTRDYVDVAGVGNVVSIDKKLTSPAAVKLTVSAMIVPCTKIETQVRYRVEFQLSLGTVAQR